MASTVSFRLPDEMAGKLEGISRETRRTKAFIIKEALERYLEEYADYRIALDRLNDKDDGIISADELRKRLGL